MKNAEIITVRLVGDEPLVWTRHHSGPRGLDHALKAHQVEREDAQRCYGNVNGEGWMEVVPAGGGPNEGIRLDHPVLAGRYPKPPPGGAPFSWWRLEISRAGTQWAGETTC